MKCFYLFLRMVYFFIFAFFISQILYTKNYFIKYKHVLGSGDFKYEGVTDDNKYFITLYDYEIHVYFLQGNKKLFLNSIKTDTIIENIFYNNHSIFIDIEGKTIKYDIRSDSFKEEDDKSKKSINIIPKREKVYKEIYRIGITDSDIKIGDKVVFLNEEPISYCYYTDKEIDSNFKDKKEIEKLNLKLISKLFYDLKIDSFILDKKYIKSSEGFVVCYPDIDTFFKLLENKKSSAKDSRTLFLFLEFYPKDKDIIKSLLKIKINEKKKEEMESLLKKYYNVVMDDSDINTILADFYYNEGDYKTAKNYLKKINSAYSYFLQGNISLTEKKIKEAEINYKKSIDIDKRFYKSYNNLATMYMEQKKYQLAENLLIEGILNNVDSPSLYYNLGLLYEKMGKTPIAVLLYEKSYSIIKKGGESTNKKEIINSLYFSYIKMNDLDEAEELIKDVINNDPSDSISYYNLAYVYELKRDIKKAVFYYNLFLEISGANTNIKLVNRVKENIRKLLQSAKE